MANAANNASRATSVFTDERLVSIGVLKYLHHPRQVRLLLLVWARRFVVGAGKGQEGIYAV